MRTTKVISYVSLLVFIAILITATIFKIQLNQRCLGHLKRAADANTIELALSEMNIAINYLKEKDMTTGYTSILYKTPDEDIAFWYNNLVSSRNELLKVQNANHFEKTNELMKLRESLLDTQDGNTILTYPKGLHKYPHNLLFCFIVTISSLLFIIFKGVEIIL